MTDDGFLNTLAPAAGATCVIEVSEDLVHWSALMNVVRTNASMLIRDLDAERFGKRFYRARPVNP